MRPLNRCNCFCACGKVGCEICVVVQWCDAGVAVMTCCIAARVCEVRARLTIVLGCVRVTI